MHISFGSFQRINSQLWSIRYSVVGSSYALSRFSSKMLTAKQVGKPYSGTNIDIYLVVFKNQMKKMDLISFFLFKHPNLFELICGNDMDMMLNHFVFLLPNTSNCIRQKFIDLFFICFLKTAELMSIFQTFVPQYIYQNLMILISQYIRTANKNMEILHKLAHNCKCNIHIIATREL